MMRIILMEKVISNMIHYFSRPMNIIPIDLIENVNMQKKTYNKYRNVPQQQSLSNETNKYYSKINTQYNEHIPAHYVKNGQIQEYS